MPNCELTWEFECPLDWDDLSEVAESSSYCDECTQNVYRVETNRAALKFAREGKCVARIR